MRIASWNVNSAKARQDHILSYLSSGACDVLLIQETKTQDPNFPEDLYREIGWNVAYHGQKSYNGVAIASRHPLEDVHYGLPGDDEDEQARYMEATVGGVRVATIYLPNGNPAPGPKFDFKLAWMERLRARAAHLLASEDPIVLAGDFNVIPQDIDCYDPAGWEGDALTRAVHYVLADDRVFLNTSSDARLLRAACEAALSLDGRPSDEAMEADALANGVLPIFDGGELERI